MLQSIDFWMVTSFLVIAVVLFKYGAAPVLSALDERAAKIKKQLKEAENLREEAQELLANYTRKKKAAIKEAKDITEMAEKESQKMHETAKKDIEKMIKNREKQATDRIQSLQNAAIREVRDQAVDIALNATRGLLKTDMDEKKSSTLIDATINDLGKSFKKAS